MKKFVQCFPAHQAPSSACGVPANLRRLWRIKGKGGGLHYILTGKMFSQVKLNRTGKLTVIPRQSRKLGRNIVYKLSICDVPKFTVIDL